ncbi:MAG: YeeE/YedE family protein [Burkholderiales bacterium]|nr:YeeE/YedE family protein [Burkholderiales bacterium]
MDAKAVAHLPVLVAGAAFALAFVFGFVANRTNFCTMGAVADVVNFGDWRRMRMWVLAIAIAIAGAGALTALGLVDLRKSIYTGANVAWVSALVGGFLFGFGMTLASGCGSKSLIRAGTGNLKSWVVLIVLAIAAYMTLKGLFAVWRTVALDPWKFNLGAASSDLPTLLAAVGLTALKPWVPFVVAALLLVYVFKDRDFRATPELILGGVVVGLVVVGGWYVSGHVGFLAEDPATLEEKFVATNSGRMESFSFVSPVAYTLELLMFWSDTTRIVTFGIAGVLGMLAGSFAYALVSKSFRWEGFGSVEDVGNHIVGAIMMGFGGVTALGCTIGQGLTGVSTLAVGSILALAAIVAGAVAAVRYQVWRLEKMA